jgi:hypothetical protein
MLIQWKIITACCLVGLTVVVSPAFGQGDAADDKAYTMVSARTTGVVDKVELTLEAVGVVIQFLEGLESQSRKMQMQAGFRYEERTEKYDAKSMEHLQSVRYYNIARADIQIGDQSAKPSLDLNRRQIVCDVRNNKVSLFSSIGPLKDDQLLLIEDLPANSLLLDKLLPDKPVRVGDKWTFSDEVLAPMLSLDAMESQNLEAVLMSVKDDIALVEINGDVEGAFLGAGSTMNIRLMYQFDLVVRRIVWLGMVITESRSLGNVGPAVDLIAKLTLKITPAIESTQLKQDRVIIIPDDIEKHLTLIYDSPNKGPWRFSHGRNWYIIHDEPNNTKMRLMINGALVSQCDIVQMGKADSASGKKLVDFQRDLKNELKDSFGKFLAATEGKTSKNYRELRVVISNASEDMPLLWIYYLLTRTDGTQVILAFVVRRDMLEAFNDADHAIVDSFEMSANSRR